MAKYQARVKIKYGVDIEINANNEVDALAGLDDLLENQLPDIGGNYAGGDKVEVFSLATEVFGFFNKSNKADEDQKKQNINAYIAQLDNEEKELLREILGG